MGPPESMGLHAHATAEKVRQKTKIPQSKTSFKKKKRNREHYGVSLKTKQAVLPAFVSLSPSVTSNRLRTLIQERSVFVQHGGEPLIKARVGEGCFLWHIR